MTIAEQIVEDRIRAARIRDWVIERRTTLGDPDIGVMPDDLLGLIQYAASHRNVDAGYRRAEAAELWWLGRHLARENDRAAYALMLAGAAAGLTFSDWAPVLGVAGRAGAEARLRRLEAAAAGDTKDTRHVRGARSAAKKERQLRTDRAAAILALARRLVESVNAERAEDVALALAEHGPGAEPSAVLLAQVRLLMGELLEEGVPDAELHAVLTEGAQLVGLRVRL